MIDKLSPEAEEAAALIEKHFKQSKHSDLMMLNPTERHFIFNSRDHVRKYREGTGSFFFTERQLKWLKDLIDRTQDPAYCREMKSKFIKKQVSALKREVTRLTGELKNAKQELKEAQEELERTQGESEEMKEQLSS